MFWSEATQAFNHYTQRGKVKQLNLYVTALYIVVTLYITDTVYCKSGYGKPLLQERGTRVVQW